MTRSPRPRKASWISDSLNRQLSIYALAASAAGVNTMALSQAAEAKIVYTPTRVKIAPLQPYGINFDNSQGKPNLHLLWNGTASGHSSLIAYANTGGVAYKPSSRRKPYESAIFAGGKIGPERTFSKPGPRMASHSREGESWLGPWANGGKGVKDRYLGVKFKIAGKFHYGWTRITVTTGPRDRGFTGMILTGYAYETIPGRPIIAGATKGPEDAESSASPSTPSSEPTTLGVLALGAPGLSIWRRESVAAALESN
jgi:hypothetical protein